MAWPINPRAARSLVTMRDQINAQWPNRAKGNDGMIGDPRHQARKSDHNPNRNGVVQAMDVTDDPVHGPSAERLAYVLVASRDERIKYLIWNDKIVSSTVSPWKWRPSGEDARRHHVHISISDAPERYDDPRKWYVQPEPSNEFLHSGKGSWYSQLRGIHDWVDTGDKPNSNALGVPDAAQGISFMNSQSLGEWFEVQAPNGKVQIEQQTDIGPHPRTGRLIDISAAAAERFGYSPRDFPTDGIFLWRPIKPPVSVANLSRRAQGIRYYELRNALAQK